MSTAFMVTRSSAAPGETEMVWWPSGEAAETSPTKPSTSVPLSPTWRSGPHVTPSRSAPVSAAIHSR
jgi:hypothetical protein